MSTVDIPMSTLSEADHHAQLRRALVASTVGTLIEWYDFLLYGTVSALIFGKLYFPHSSPIVGVLEAFSVFFIGFVGRPIGAAIFGHWGDRIGRKATLIVTLLVTGISTVAVGLVPTYASIGIWGAVLLTVIRLIQGIGVGGEWGGSVLLAMEWARTTKNRGFLTSWPQFGAPAGFFLANLAVLFFSWLSGDQFVTWGWRIPFFLSIVMVGIGLWIRLGILETPVFQKVLAEERVERVPVLEVLKRQPKQVALSALLAHAGAGAWLHRRGFYLYLWHDRPRRLTRFSVNGSPRPMCPWLPVGRGRRKSVRPHRAQEYVHDWLRVCCGLRFHLLRPARHEGAGIDLYCSCAVASPSYDVLWPRGGADSGKLHAAFALQRHLAWLSARLDHRRRPVAVYRNGIIRCFQIKLTDRTLYGWLRHHRYHLDGAADGLHQQRHL
jgi:MFS family permease